jgi:hypothetical protein
VSLLAYSRSSCSPLLWKSRYDQVRTRYDIQGVIYLPIIEKRKRKKSTRPSPKHPTAIPFSPLIMRAVSQDSDDMAIHVQRTSKVVFSSSLHKSERVS